MKVDSLFFSKGQGKGHSPLGGRQGNVTGQEQEASTADHQAAGGRRHVIIIKASVCGGERIRGEGHSPLTGLTDEGGGKGMWPVKSKERRRLIIRQQAAGGMSGRRHTVDRRPTTWAASVDAARAGVSNRI
jgi:hypothetical protein